MAMRRIALLLTTLLAAACAQRPADDARSGDRTETCAEWPAEPAPDSANVVLVLTIEADGRLSAVMVDAETPSGRGFGEAAMRCIARFRFRPGRDRDGKPVRMTKRVAIHFVR